MTTQELQQIENMHEKEVLMELAGLDPALGFEALAVQSDGAVICCDRCGNFGYIALEDFK